MMRILGVLLLLISLYGGLIGTYIDDAPDSEPTAKLQKRIFGNIFEVANIQGRYGLLTLGAALVIITGGVDLSLGAVVGCSAILFGYLTQRVGLHPGLSLLLVLAFGSFVGLSNGLLITRLNLQPFLVTLCGMFVYRGIARLLQGQVSVHMMRDAHPEFTYDLNVLRLILTGKDFEGALIFPAEFVWLIFVALIVGLFLHFTAYGRYWYAIGHNDLGAKYAGINVQRNRVAVYVIASTLASLAGVMLLLDISVVQADSGGMGLELYAILGAVLGGCSLRGGEGTAIGMVLGAMVLPILDSLLNIRGVKSDVIPAVIGLTLLLGTIMDEIIRRRSRGRF